MGALPSVTTFATYNVIVGDAGASALAAALGRGALPRLMSLGLGNATIGDAALVALAPALRRLPALEELILRGNPFGDEGLAALLAPPPPAGALRTTTGGLKKLKALLSTSAPRPRSPTRDAPLWPPRSTAARCLRSRISDWIALLPATRRSKLCLRHSEGREPGAFTEPWWNAPPFPPDRLLTLSTQREMCTTPGLMAGCVGRAFVIRAYGDCRPLKIPHRLCQEAGTR